MFLHFAVNHLKNVFKVLPGKRLRNDVLSRLYVTSDVECLLRCQRSPGCESINFICSTVGSRKQSLCELNRHTKRDLSDNLHTDDKSSYYHDVVT